MPPSGEGVHQEVSRTQESLQAGEEYGYRWLQEVVATHRRDPLKVLGKAIEADTNRFSAGVPCADGRAMVAVRRT